MARLTATFGTPKDRTPDQMRMMVAEWFRVLKPYGIHTVTRAFDKVIETAKWFPTIAEIADHCSNDLESWRDAIGIDVHETGQKPFTDKPRGALGPEDVAKRVADCLRWKQEAGFGQSGPDPLDGKTKPKEASQESTVSFALLNSCAVRRAKGLETCRPDCGDRMCNLRTC